MREKLKPHRTVALALLWLALSGFTTSDRSLMPIDGRMPLFGPDAVVHLHSSEASHPRYALRPRLEKDVVVSWHLHWDGNRYLICDLDELDKEISSAEDMSIAFRSMSGMAKTLIAEVSWTEPPEADGTIITKYNYVLATRSGHDEVIGYGDFMNDTHECEVIARPKLLALGMKESDLDACAARSWPVAEALMRAYAAQRPEPIGVMHRQHGEPPRPQVVDRPR